MKFKHSNSSQAFKLKNLKFGNFMCAFSTIFSQQKIATTIRQKKMAQATTYTFEAEIASRGYHVYKSHKKASNLRKHGKRTLYQKCKI